MPGRYFRGCSFVGKTLNAERAGARLVIITDHAIDNDSRMIDMVQDETSRTVTIPAFFLFGKDGYVCVQLRWVTLLVTLRGGDSRIFVNFFYDF